LECRSFLGHTNAGAGTPAFRCFRVEFSGGTWGGFGEGTPDGLGDEPRSGHARTLGLGDEISDLIAVKPGGHGHGLSWHVGTSIEGITAV